MPAASSSTARRSSGLAVTSAPTRPWLTMPEAVRAGRQVGEQRLHVAGAHLLAVHPVFAAGAALDAADDLQFRLLVERRRRGAGRLVQRQRHLGQVARRPPGGAGEDHIVHLAGAQRAGALLAHRPAQRLDHVGLAAAVRADDAGQARMDLHADRFGEALEPGDAQAAKLHGQCKLLR